MGEYGAALADFTKDTELNPELAAAYNWRGRTYGVMGEYEKALPDYDKAIELNLEGANAYYGRGGVYREMGQVENAIADFERCLKLTDNPKLRQFVEQLLHELRH